ncbi:MAG TPA: thiamine pyrophosphate-dependent enzyme, partial [Gammaproteobacteria bacterium]|nr:thiamine pyrophosphate-dependent enzyme [Gammaproteobacteria bacterium]
GTEIHRHSAVPQIHRRTGGYGVEAHWVDGMDVRAVHDATRSALQHVREGNGPVLLECETYRYRGHSMADPAAYRSALEVSELRARDPLLTFREWAEAEGVVGPEESAGLQEAAAKAVEEAAAFAAESPPPTDLQADVYTRPLNLYGGRQ